MTVAELEELEMMARIIAQPEGAPRLTEADPTCVRYDHFPAALMRHHEYLLRAAREKLAPAQYTLDLA